jgi:hypothetical protein
MTEDNKSPNKTQPTTTQTQTQTPQTEQPSKPGSKDLGVMGSRFLASEEEHLQFASNYGSELVITMGNSNPGKQ